MDLKHLTNLKNMSSIVLLTLILTTTSTVYSMNNTNKAIDTKNHSTPYTQVFMLNEARGSNFSSSSTKISKKGQTRLDLFVKQAIASGTTPSLITIVGHTDNVGSQKANKHLSEQRAIAVANHLANKGLNSTLMHVTGYGATRPVATNESRIGRAQNRRIVIRIQSEKNHHLNKS